MNQGLKTSTAADIESTTQAAMNAFVTTLQKALTVDRKAAKCRQQLDRILDQLKADGQLRRFQVVDFVQTEDSFTFEVEVLPVSDSNEPEHIYVKLNL